MFIILLIDNLIAFRIVNYDLIVRASESHPCIFRKTTALSINMAPSSPSSCVVKLGSFTQSHRNY